MFGTKNIDFNYDSSVFKRLDLLIKRAKELLKITNKIQQKLIKNYNEKDKHEKDEEDIEDEENNNNNNNNDMTFSPVK